MTRLSKCIPLKKPNRKKSQWLLAARAKKEKLRRRAKVRHTHRKRHPADERAALVVNRHNRGQKQPVRDSVVIELQERLDLDEHYEATITDLGNVRRASELGVKIRQLSFMRMNYISPAAALLLASEVDCWNERTRKRLRPQVATWNPGVKKLLYQMGFFELLDLPKPEDLDIPSNTTFLPFIKGEVSLNKTDAGEKARELGEKIKALAGAEIRPHLLYAGLTEAITNVSHHAYEADAARRPWWMSGAFDKEQNKIVVCFCDHGLTIPGTLRASKKFEKFWDLIKGWNDSQRLKAAMELGRSSTGEEGRGKGLQDFLGIINTFPISTLRIFSSRGKLVVSKNGNSGMDYASQVAEQRFKGTLIEWQFVPTTKIEIQ